MAKKRKAAAKKPKKPAGANAPKPRAKAPPQRPGSGTSPKSGGNSRAGNSTSFEEAKSAAIDSLIQAIEEAERRLSAVKRAGSYDELQRIGKGAIS